MDQLSSGEGEAQTSKSESSSFHLPEPWSQRASSFSSSRDREAYALQWTEIERLPTFERLRTSLFDSYKKEEEGGRELKETRVIDVAKLGRLERRVIIEGLIKHIEKDNLRLRVNVKLPTVEVRYKNLSVDAECEVVKGKPLPTLWNSTKSFFSGLLKVPGLTAQEAKISILKDVSGIIKPSRLTLLLGPPGCGKTTFLLALSGKLDKSLKVGGEVSYNGFDLGEFVPEKTSAYISQYDLHIPEITVRETLDFSARCQGIGSRAEIMKEVSRREKEARIVPWILAPTDKPDFVQVLSRKDQEQYWDHPCEEYKFVSEQLYEK